ASRRLARKPPPSTLLPATMRCDASWARFVVRAVPCQEHSCHVVPPDAAFGQQHAQVEEQVCRLARQLLVLLLQGGDDRLSRLFDDLLRDVADSAFVKTPDVRALRQGRQ